MKQITVIGAANIDISGFSAKPINMADSNPGHIEYFPGGVGRNIAENLLRIGAAVRLVSVIGDDPFGRLLVSHSREIGLDISGSKFLSNTDSSVYIALMNNTGEMALALSDMSVLERLTPGDIEERAALVEDSDAVVLDAGLSPETLRFIPERFSGKIIYLDPVSSRKAEKVRCSIGAFHTLKLNRMEASSLSGIELPAPAVNPVITLGKDESAVWTGDESLHRGLETAGAHFLRQGSKRVFITLGRAGVYYRGTDDEFLAPVTPVTPRNTTGGGDAFMAGIVYGTQLGMSSRRIVSFAAAMGSITIQSKMTVSPEMTIDKVRRICPEEK
ncbi:MAG: carbohydrate kinase family protein [Treponema sp.]|jgi:pseudouridine kinase|nr:carbohydrate kinase family protein [Treponema sp.]